MTLSLGLDGYATSRRRRTVWLSAVALPAWLVLLVLLTPLGAAAEEATAGLAADDGALTVSYFWGEGCPFCEQQAVFLDALEQAHPDVRVDRYEVWSSAENQQRMADALAPFGVEPTGVPATVIGDRYWVGFNERIGSEIADVVADASTVTLAPEVSNPPDVVLEDPADVEATGEGIDRAGEDNPAALAAGNDAGSEGGVLLGLGVAVAILAVGGLVLALTRHKAAPARQRR